MQSAHNSNSLAHSHLKNYELEFQEILKNKQANREIWDKKEFYWTIPMYYLIQITQNTYLSVFNYNLVIRLLHVHYDSLVSKF
jgi:hypothetical protein